MNLNKQKLINACLSLATVGSITGTFICTIKESAKYSETYYKAESKKDKFIKFVNNYKFSLLFASIGISSSLANCFLNNKMQANLIATIGMLDVGLRQHKEKIKETLGIDGEKSILKKIMKSQFKDQKIINNDSNKQLYWEEHIGYFYARPEDIFKAILLVNQDLSCGGAYYYTGLDHPGWITISELVTLMNAEPLSHNLNPCKMNFGWSWDYMSEFWEYPCIHFDIDEPDENGARLITWMEAPIWNPRQWYDHRWCDCRNEEYFKDADPKIVNFNAMEYEILK